MTKLSLRLLGPFQAYLDDRPLTSFESDKARALLAYLAVEMGNPQPRSKTASLFWPDWSESKARANLRATLANLRTTLLDRNAQPPLILANRQTICFDPTSNHYLDIQKFSDSLKAIPSSWHNAVDTEGIDAKIVVQIQRAVNLYQGPFMDGFYLDACAEYESWLLFTRERLQRQQVDALQLLAQFFEYQGDYVHARGYAERQIEIDPLDESAQRLLMRNLARLGQRSAALLTYITYRQRLSEELGLKPDAETVTLHHQIQRGELFPPYPKSDSQTALRRRPESVSMRHRTVNPLHNLPASMTSFVGRMKEQKTICQLLRQNDVRMVTITGPGGVGKTRLALEAARTLVPDFADGIYFVELAPLREAEVIAATLAQTLDIRESGSQSLREALLTKLRDKQMLIFLDNFEHVMDGAKLVTELMATAPQVKVLITSRERLRLYGEHEVSIQPLTVPAHEGDPALSDVHASDAVRLFIQRAQAVQPDFMINDENAQPIAQICTYLDGLPLAIELAAARMRYDSFELLWGHICDEQRDVLPLLRHGPRNVEPKHQTMQSAIAWSYNLLTIPEQIVFRHLSVFVGGCTVDAIAVLCSHVDASLSNVEDCLHSLLDKHLIQQKVNIGGPTRYAQLETIREYGFEQLVAHGEDDVTCLGHVDYYLALAESVDAEFRQGGNPAYMVPIRREQDNLRAAMMWTIEQGKTKRALRLSGVLTNLWESEGLFSEGLNWSQKVIQLAQSEAPAPATLKAIWYAGFLARGLGEFETAKPLFEQCLKLSRQIEEPHWTARSMSMLADIHFLEGNYEEMVQLDRKSLQIRRTLPVDWSYGMALTNMGGRMVRVGNRLQARLYLEEGRAILSELEHPYGLTNVLLGLSRLAIQEGDYHLARQHVEEAMGFAKETGHSNTYSGVLSGLSEVAIAEGDYATAREFATEALTLRNRAGETIKVLELLDLFAILAQHQGDPLLAVKLAGATAGQRKLLGVVMPPVDREKFNQEIALAHKELTSQAAATAWAEGEGMTLEEAIAAAVR